MASKRRLGKKLSKAAWYGDKLAVEELLRERADPNFEGGFFCHPPLMAAHQGGDHTEIMVMLVEAGADVLTLSSSLGWFAQEGNTTMVRLLLNAGAKPDEVGGKYIETPLIAACKSGHQSIVSELIKAGTDVNAISAAGITPIFGASLTGNGVMVFDLIEAGANVNTTCGGITPLMAAAQSGDFSTLRILINNGAEMNRIVKNTTRKMPPVKNGMSALDVYRAFHGEGRGVELLAGNNG